MLKKKVLLIEYQSFRELFLVPEIKDADVADLQTLTVTAE